MDDLTRRRLIELGRALPLALAACGEESSATLARTPTCDDGDETPELTEGPYFIPGSPRRRNLRGNTKGRALLVTVTRTRTAASGSSRSCPGCIRAARATSTSRSSRAAASS